MYLCPCNSGFVKILNALVKSSLVFVLVEGGLLAALKFFVFIQHYLLNLS